MEPILHLSIPVRDLAESVVFYRDALGCRAGRIRSDYADIWFFGMQVTLHDRPDEVTVGPTRGVRHFGVTLDADTFATAVERLDRLGVPWLVPVSTDEPGTPREQTKGKVADPSGNVIELKTYPDPESALAD